MGPTKEVTTENDGGDELGVRAIQDRGDNGLFVSVSIKGQEVQMLADTGSMICVLSLDVFRTLELSFDQLRQLRGGVRGVSGQLPCLGCPSGRDALRLGQCSRHF